ncbi:molybdenum cofactor guanylyltransferase [Pedobacter mucosus]|uniref:molybdenum cofactor guanylyltransferase n=1 Tax=Pedobacter mucosus TaxID=2895286 RepID=UPI001EE3E5E6|nr:molybdenum cofactor guanylyltransferase [Pedobacter mucosus]UKT64239.1 molybdenum cofactor guanylyltransferase [Pedobacter mucosus]
MLGIILSGGQSIRMGADKGLLKYQNKLWAEAAVEKFKSLNIPVKISVNPAQQQTYASHFRFDNLIVDYPDLDVKGPLLGILSAHLVNSEEDLFLLACDMLLMETRFLKMLNQSMISNNSFDAYIFTKNGQQEPLCGIYKSAGLEKIMLLLQTTGLAKYSMKFMLSNLNVCEIPLVDQDFRCFENFNSSAEIRSL